MQVLNAGIPEVGGLNPLLFREKLWVFSSLLMIVPGAGGGVYGETVS